MSSSQPNVVKVVEADAELRADQRVSRRVKLSSHAIWLEAIDTSCYIVYVVPPAGNHRVPLDGLTRHTGGSQGLLEA
jgi:hypothetical protein